MQVDTTTYRSATYLYVQVMHEETHTTTLVYVHPDLMKLKTPVLFNIGWSDVKDVARAGRCLAAPTGGFFRFFFLSFFFPFSHGFLWIIRLAKQKGGGKQKHQTPSFGRGSMGCHGRIGRHATRRTFKNADGMP